ncbi:MAG: hypothetical protein J6Q58_01470 [Clostridia bacterium]|nr:hypothetical protein [Clostridia bacterium]
MANKKRRVEEQEKQTAKKPVKKSFIVKLSAIIVAVIFFIFCIGAVLDSYAPANPKDYHVWGLSGIFGSFNKNGNPESYWQVNKTKSGDNELAVYASLRVTGASYSDIKEIWVNLSDLYEDQLEIDVINGSASKSINKFNLKADNFKANKNGWVKIYDVVEANSNTTDNYLQITTTIFYIGFNTKINVRELVFVSKANNVLDYDVRGVKIGNQEIGVDDDELEDIENGANVVNIKDEQEFFKKS